jgi:hypothetical protein
MQESYGVVLWIYFIIQRNCAFFSMLKTWNNNFANEKVHKSYFKKYLNTLSLPLPSGASRIFGYECNNRFGRQGSIVDVSVKYCTCATSKENEIALEI